MIYDVRQTTRYTYASPVAFAQHVLRLTPVNRMAQRVHASTLGVSPQPVQRRENLDFFGNRLTHVRFDSRHDSLTVRVAARVLVGESLEIGDTPKWETVRDAAFACADIRPTSPAHYMFPSRQVTLDPEIRDYAAQSFHAGRSIFAGAGDLMRRINEDFTYEVGATTVSTTPPMSFALRRGVCQDFAHIMIAGLRGLGLPAAYVSGYLCTVPSSDGTRLQGADAMHAWVLVWCGSDAGWVGFDPTNAILATDSHIVLAVGRDYADVAPIDGVIFASGGQRLSVSVDVLPIPRDGEPDGGET